MRVYQDWQAVEETERAMRVIDFLKQATPPVLIKDIRSELGLSYRQARRVLTLLENAGFIHISVTAEWNGCFYIYPHRIWLS